MEVPRYLFRVYSPGSDGSNSTVGFGSMANASGHSSFTLADLSDNDAAAMLEDHVLWRSWGTRDNDTLISLTPSLIFAILHALRKVQRGYKTNLANCYIAVIDTRSYPKGTFSWTPDLMRRYGLEQSKNRLFREEYHCIHVSDQSLLKNGNAYEIWPDLRAKHCKGHLVQALRYIRIAWYRTEQPVSKAEIAAARGFAQCFGGKWYLPMMVWALASRARSSDDSILLGEFSDEWNGVIDHPYLYDNGDIKPSAELRELCEWAKLMRWIELTQASLGLVGNRVGGSKGNGSTDGINVGETSTEEVKKRDSGIERPSIEAASTEKSISEQSTTEQSTTEQSTTEQSTTEQSITGEHDEKELKIEDVLTSLSELALEQDGEGRKESLTTQG